MSEIKIDKNIPIPEPRNGKKKRHYPFAELEIGDSFFVEGFQWKSIGELSGSYNKYRKVTKKKFISRKVTENNIKGLRIWRTK